MKLGTLALGLKLTISPRYRATQRPQVDYKMLTCDAIVGKTPGDNVSIENHNWDNLLSISLSVKAFY